MVSWGSYPHKHVDMNHTTRQATLANGSTSREEITSNICSKKGVY